MVIPWRVTRLLTIDPNFQRDIQPFTSQVRCPSNNSANSKLADFTTKPADLGRYLEVGAKDRDESTQKLPGFFFFQVLDFFV